MKYVMIVLAALVLAACCNCKAEPIVEQNRRLIIPPNIGNLPIAADSKI
ncbi:MAG: hypothetical protein FWD33_00345 [Alphaproteobacteria bacterium]|nr:hypothetical protein [Alphaproteobacteria bacterium]